MINSRALLLLVGIAAATLPLAALAAEKTPLLPPFSPLEIKRSGAPCGSIITLADGAFLTVEGNATIISRDQGVTWGERRVICADFPIDAPQTVGVPGGGPMLIRTKDNTIVMVWRDRRIDDWDKKTGELGPKSAADVWTMRSLDGGKTWSGRQKIFTGVCGHPPINLLQVANGDLVVPVQYYASFPLRCVIRTYVSSDNGQTWRGGNIIDLGGHGHHDGAFEPSLVERRDGTVWMLIRTNYDRFWEAISDDHGLNWRTIRPTTISASSSPPYLTRLASGRLILFYNRLYPEGQTSYERRGMPFSEVAGSWHREELTVVLSDDDGKTWTAPRVIAREPKKWLSYSYVFEPQTGSIWLFSGQGKFAGKAREADLLAGK